MRGVKKILREPLVHFLAIGAGLFLLFSLLQDRSAETPARIVVAAGQVEQLAAQFARTWLRPPTAVELAGLIDDHVRDEVYYREALALGLDKNDPLIRRRLRQKLEFILEDLSSVQEPSDEVLATFLQEQAAKFRFAPRISFRQVYLNPARHPDLQSDAEKILAELRLAAPPETLGDPTLLGTEFQQATPYEIGRHFGDAFARKAVALPPGEDWAGPIYSGLGAHLVRVIERKEGRLPELAEIRPQVEREWLAQHRQRMKKIAYQKLLEGYEVIIEQPPTVENTAAAPMEATAAVADRQ